MLICFCCFLLLLTDCFARENGEVWEFITKYDDSLSVVHTITLQGNNVLLGFGAGLQKRRLQDYFFLLLTKSDGVPPLSPCSGPTISGAIRLLNGALAV